MIPNGAKLKADVDRTVLTDECSVYKTERLSAECRELKDLDKFISKLADAAILSGLGSRRAAGGSFRLTAGAHNLFFVYRDGNMVFFAYKSADSAIRINDRRLTLFMSSHPEFDVSVSESGLMPAEADLKKLYRVAEAEGINYPKLNPEQRAAVEAEDRSVLVRGVAGSGKTNLCIDKILFAASRNYSGKALYTTYSRGLLTDTAKKIAALKKNIDDLLAADAAGKTVVRGKDIKRALEYKLGVYLPNAENWRTQLKNIGGYLENNVECALISDLYREYTGKRKELADENYFIREFVPSPSNRAKGLFKRLTDTGAEVVYKEIYGYIFGKYRTSPLSEEQYISERSGDFTRQEAEAIYRIAKEYHAFLRENGAADNPLMARELIAAKNLPRYSVVVADEVQDFTEWELKFLNAISLKFFAAGDALQMINPSYFSFAYLRSLMWRDGVKSAELNNNYRSTKKIAELTDKLAELNMSRFGTHNFVLRSRAIDSNIDTATVYVRGGAFGERLSEASLDGYTLITGDMRSKEKLRAAMPSAEILTVSEAKGLERDVVIMYNVLSDFSDRWAALERLKLDRKNADENSVYRYYFNLFYVGVTRAKSHLTVFESRDIPLFRSFFASEFTSESADTAVARLKKMLGGTVTDDSELKRRAEEFMRLNQYDNARVAADRIRDDELRRTTLTDVDIRYAFVRTGDYRGAGIRYWEKGMYDRAREMFTLSHDPGLIEFMDACIGSGEAKLDYNIVAYFNEVTDDAARRLITDTVTSDLKQMKENMQKIRSKLEDLRRKHG